MIRKCTTNETICIVGSISTSLYDLLNKCFQQHKSRCSFCACNYEAFVACVHMCKSVFQGNA